MADQSIFHLFGPCECIRKLASAVKIHNNLLPVSKFPWPNTQTLISKIYYLNVSKIYKNQTQNCLVFGFSCLIFKPLGYCTVLSLSILLFLSDAHKWELKGNTVTKWNVKHVELKDRIVLPTIFQQIRFLSISRVFTKQILGTLKNLGNFLFSEGWGLFWKLAHINTHTASMGGW